MKRLLLIIVCLLLAMNAEAATVIQSTNVFLGGFSALVAIDLAAGGSGGFGTSTVTTGGATYTIQDTFSTGTNVATDTETTWTNVGGTLSISSGQAHGSASVTTTVLNATQLGTDQIVDAEIMGSSGADRSSIILKSTSNTSAKLGAEINSVGTLALTTTNGSCTGGTGSTYAGSYTAMQAYAVQVQTTYNSGPNTTSVVVRIKEDGVNWTERINTTCNSTSTASLGNYVGFVIKRGATNADVTVDNFHGN